jgi:hypothetical protein
VRLLLSTVLLAAAPLANACGVCIDDKIASCYDHAVVSAAYKRGHAVAFFAIEGDIVRSDETRKAVSNAIAKARGVRPGTARISLENAALSFAYDPAERSAHDVGRAVGHAIADRKLRLKLLRVMQPTGT